MLVFDVGQSVFQLRFLPDGRRLVVAAVGPGEQVTFAVLSLADGGRVPLNVPNAKFSSWWSSGKYGNPIAVHPSGDICYIGWAGHLYAFRNADGKSLRTPKDIQAHQLALSPDGGRLLAAYCSSNEGQVSAATAGRKGWVLGWRKTIPRLNQVAGFLPDGERFVTVEGVVCVRSFATGDALVTGRLKSVGWKHPQISPDGRLLGLVGYHAMYFWDLATLAKPRRISGSSSFGDFRSFAFHPDGKTVAVIHGGPTLVKVYDLTMLKVVHKWNWKLGPLRGVAYSPDGTLGAAGSEDGRIVVWDVDG